MASQYGHKEDNGGRRSSTNRRQFNYAAHFPERRIASDRRTRKDRSVLSQQFLSMQSSQPWYANRIIIFPASKTKA